jgi:hypothetical protein
MTLTINYENIELECQGDMTEAYYGDYEEQSEGRSFEIYKVMAGEIDITDLLREGVIEELEFLAIEQN